MNEDITNAYCVGYNKGKEDMLVRICEYLETHLWENVDADKDPIVESVANISKENFIKEIKRLL